jgi:hypothetical protein
MHKKRLSEELPPSSALFSVDVWSLGKYTRPGLGSASIGATQRLGRNGS